MILPTRRCMAVGLAALAAVPNAWLGLRWLAIHKQSRWSIHGRRVHSNGVLPPASLSAIAGR